MLETTTDLRSEMTVLGYFHLYLYKHPSVTAYNSDGASRQQYEWVKM